MRIGKIFLLLAYYFCFYAAAVSQDRITSEKFEQGITKKNIPNGYQLGINTHFAIDGIFNQSVRTPFEMLLRKPVRQDQAIRVRVLGTTQNSRRNELDYLNEAEESVLGLALGYEWQQTIGKRWDWYYGFEVEGKRQWGNDLEDYIIGNQYSNEKYHVIILDEQLTTGFSLLPLLGFRFEISSRLFVHTEFKLEALWQKSDQRTEYNVTTINGSQESLETSFEDFSDKNAKVDFRPYTGVFINFVL